MDYVQPEHQYDDGLRVVAMIKQYLQVTKPGIIFGNLISVIVVFLSPQKARLTTPIFRDSTWGVLVAASGCVFNNYIDRDIDRIMERTKNRPLVRWINRPAN